MVYVGDQHAHCAVVDNIYDDSFLLTLPLCLCERNKKNKAALTICCFLFLSHLFVLNYLYNSIPSCSVHIMYALYISFNH